MATSGNKEQKETEKGVERLAAVCDFGIKMAGDLEWDKGRRGEEARKKVFQKCMKAKKILAEQGLLKSAPAFQDCMLSMLDLKGK